MSTRQMMACSLPEALKEAVGKEEGLALGEKSWERVVSLELLQGIYREEKV